MPMFDQQPIGPVPARRPILMPPDPEREALSDPENAEVTLVGPIPMELVEPLHGRQPGARPWRWLRWVVALLLVVPTIFNLVAAANYLFDGAGDGLLMPPARLIGAAILLVGLLVATLLFQGSQRTRDRG